MKITIIGTGYVGLVTGACLAELGNDVFCLDVDEKKIAMLNNGGIPIHEPGLEEVVARNRAAGRLHFSTDVAASVAHGCLQFIAVGTPPDEDGSADLQYVLAAARNIGKHMTEYKVIVDKSTVPVGTADRVKAAVQEQLAARGDASTFSVVSNPEFLKEGAAVEDFMRPDRIVIGCDGTPEGQKARDLMKKLYTPFNRNHERTFWMDVRSAEFTKYAANAMLATRISFMKEMRVASMALAAYLVNSAERTSIQNVRSWLRLKGVYSFFIRSWAFWPSGVLSQPMTMRSGRMKSSTAAPSFMNTGTATTENLEASARAASSSCTAALTRSAVPTGTVDLSTMTLYSVMCLPMLRAAASTYCKSAEPSSSGGVPTAMNCRQPCATEAATSVEKCKRPAARLRATTSSRPGSWIGMPPLLSMAIFFSSTSRQKTSLPNSARQAPVTRPT